jgi:exodeoxyribonuclease-3
MKLISWNVNGLRSCIGKGFLDFFWAADADIFCLQETKIQKDQVELELPGYGQYYNYAEKKGYSGTAVFSRLKPLEVTYGLGIPDHDREGRVITVYYEGFTLVNVYTPNSKRELLRLDYRMEWEDAFRAYLTALDRQAPVVVCGDMNVAHREIDIKRPKANVINAGFTIYERNKMSDLLDSGFTDTFRYLYPDKTDAYTWWSYMGNSREKGVGWRIDYFLASRRLGELIQEAYIYDGGFGSAHCPVGLELGSFPKILTDLIKC